MANVGGGRGGKAGRNPAMSVQEIVPSSVWTEDEKCHYLIIDLPGTEFSSPDISDYLLIIIYSFNIYM